MSLHIRHGDGREYAVATYEDFQRLYEPKGFYVVTPVPNVLGESRSTTIPLDAMPGWSVVITEPEPVEGDADEEVDAES